MRIVPEKRLVALGFVAAAVATVAGYAPSLSPVMWALDAIVVLAAAVDVLLARGTRIRAEREVAEILSVGRSNLVTLTLRNVGSRALTATVMDDPLDSATVSGLPAQVKIPAGATVLVKYEVTPTRRGPRDFRAVTVRYPSLLGLVSRQESTELEQRCDVYPDVHAARELEMLRRKGRGDVRLGSMRVRGGDTEFERLRPYQRGDEPRHVDWRASARRDDLTVRQFQAESDQNVVFAIDVGRGMRGESQGITSVDRALNAALLTADVALRGGDKAGLMTFDDLPRTFVKPSGGRSGGRKLTRAVYDLEAGLTATDYLTAMTFLRAKMRARSLLVVFTNLLEPRSAKELASSLRGLLPHHLPLCVLMRDERIDQLALDPVRGEKDLFVRAAAAEALSFREGILRDLRHSGVLVLDARPEDVTPELVKRYLEVKARRLL
jgi:uncharacterized protein (DUF58 family)